MSDHGDIASRPADSSSAARLTRLTILRPKAPEILKLHSSRLKCLVLYKARYGLISYWDCSVEMPDVSDDMRDYIRALKEACSHGLEMKRKVIEEKNKQVEDLEHENSQLAHTFAELLYLGLTTLVGNRTLGEEYCDIVQVEAETGRLAGVWRRGGYILGSVLLPYSLNRILPGFRRRVRAKLEARLQQPQPLHKSQQRQQRPDTPTRITRTIQAYILHNLDTLTSPAPIYAATLAAFYFSGAYYHLSKRLLGLRYIFTRRIQPSEQRVGYEVLGVLLVLQLGVQAYLHLQQTVSSGSGAMQPDAATAAGGTAVLDHGVEVSLNPNDYAANNALFIDASLPAHQHPPQELQKVTNTPVLNRPRYDLADPQAMSWIHGKQARKCTLCLEALRDPSVTTCGHVFCWGCIRDWVAERPECPLCRGAVGASHVLPLRG
ncbi:peroxisome biogenesis factor 10 [Coniosporium apollinis]|uniref:RING-type E3 ubiquitin transferase n=1 Tax=Coniosporium apollinis TaxID=61459 RepID=A0ABQ9NYV3_9PEZI|nr:peroxisome biogenesis factor 10 [Coniosporium apollinis]